MEKEVLQNHEAFAQAEFKLHILSGTLITLQPVSDHYSENNIPGAAVRKALTDAFGDTEALRKLTISYAYIPVNGARGIPVPLSFVILKKDKAALRDRISAGRDPGDFDRIRNTAACYVADPDAENVESAVTWRRTEEAGNYNLIDQDQELCGFIAGPESALKALAELLQEDTELLIGEDTERGYGRVRMELLPAGPVPEPEKTELSSFTVRVNAPVVLTNESGVSEERPEAILQEIEKKLGCPGKLRILDFFRRTDPYCRKDHPAYAATAAGSVFRIGTADGETVDIAAIRHTFIGKFTEDGCGEIFSTPVVDRYYRRIGKAGGKKW